MIFSKDIATVGGHIFPPIQMLQHFLKGITQNIGQMFLE